MLQWLHVLLYTFIVMFQLPNLLPSVTAKASCVWGTKCIYMVIVSDRVYYFNLEKKTHLMNYSFVIQS